MGAQYDSRADALSIVLVSDGRVVEDQTIEVAGDDRCHVGVDAAGHAVDVEVLYPGRGIDALAVVAERYGLDAEALQVAARSAIGAPDREVSIELGTRTAA